MNQAHSHETTLTKEFSVKEALSYGWEMVKENTQVLVGSTAVIMIATVLISYIPEMVDSGFISFLITLAGYVLQSALGIGFIYIGLQVYHGDDVEIADLLTPMDKVWNYIGASILYGLMVGLGLILLIIPGIYLMLTFGFFPYALVDEDLGPIEALKRSKDLTEGAKWQLLLFFIVTWLLAVVGALLLGIGLLVTIPISLMMFTSVYYILKEVTDGTTPPSVSDTSSESVEVDEDMPEGSESSDTRDDSPENTEIAE